MATMGSVSSYLRQKRAIGQPVTDSDKRAAWAAYFDTQAERSDRSRSLALEKERIDTQKEQYATSQALQSSQFDKNYALTQQNYKDTADAAKISGITQIGLMGSQVLSSDIGKKAIEGISGIGKKAISGISGSPMVSTPAIGASGPHPKRFYMPSR